MKLYGLWFALFLVAFITIMLQLGPLEDRQKFCVLFALMAISLSVNGMTAGLRKEIEFLKACNAALESICAAFSVSIIMSENGVEWNDGDLPIDVEGENDTTT